MTKRKRCKRYSPEFKREALKRASEEGTTDVPNRIKVPYPANHGAGGGCRIVTHGCADGNRPRLERNIVEVDSEIRAHCCSSACKLSPSASSSWPNRVQSPAAAASRRAS